MKKMQLLGSLVEIDGANVKVMDEASTENALLTSCSGNACGDIDYQFDEDTRSYHFFNDGNKKVRLKVTSGSYFGCGGSKTRNMRPEDEWDSGFYGICDYEANYR